MLGRRRDLILIIGGLIVLNLLLGGFLVRLWKDYRSRARWLSVAAAPHRVPAPAADLSQPRQPQSVAEIVDRNVFTPLRGSVPAQPEEEAKAPKLPILFGTMNLGSGRFALMSPGDESPALSKRVLPGEEIGGYKLVSIGASNVVLEWQEKRTTLEITAPAVRGPVPERTASVRTAPAAPPNASSVVNTVSSSPGDAMPTSTAARAGQSAGPPDVPVGTVVGGKRKVVVPTPFGPVVQWQDVNPAGSQTPQQNGPPK